MVLNNAYVWSTESAWGLVLSRCKLSHVMFPAELDLLYLCLLKAKPTAPLLFILAHLALPNCHWSLKCPAVVPRGGGRPGSLNFVCNELMLSSCVREWPASPATHQYAISPTSTVLSAPRPSCLGGMCCSSRHRLPL